MRTAVDGVNDPPGGSISRVRVDGQRGDHVPDLGRLVTRLQVAKPQRVLYLLHKLQIGRHPRVRVEPEHAKARAAPVATRATRQI